MKCKECNSENLMIRPNGTHKELFCGDCLAYQKFLNKRQAQRLEIVLKERNGSHTTTK